MNIIFSYLNKNKFQEIFYSIYTRAFFYAFLSFLFLRLFTSIVMLVGIFQPSPEFSFVDITKHNIQYLEQDSGFSRVFLAPWYRWDTGHYIEIADFGYDFDPVLSVWPPFYPFLIKIVGVVFKPTIVPALIVSNIFFIFSLFLLFLYVQNIFDEGIAKNNLFFMVVFPTSFYFIAGYTESIFLFFSVAVFLLIKKKKWLWAGIISAMATLTRVQGLFLVIPIFVELIQDYYKDKNINKLLVNSFSCFYAPFAYGVFSIYTSLGLQADWPWVTLTNHWGQKLSWPWDSFIFTMRLLQGTQIENDITPNLVKYLNIIIPIITVYFLTRIRKKIPLSLSIYSWLMFLVILCKFDDVNGINSFIRYVVSIFPVFIGFALIVKNEWIKYLWFFLGLIIQIILLIYFYFWRWVA